MQVICHLSSQSNPDERGISVYNEFGYDTNVELEVDGKRYEVDGYELISAIQRCMLDSFGK